MQRRRLDAGSATAARTGPTTPSATREVTALRRAEQAAMAAFGADGRCLMRALQEELDDPDPQDCGRCSVCAGPRFARRRWTRSSVRARRPAPALASRVVLEVKQDGPGRGRGDAQARRRTSALEEGRALARLGDGGWDPRCRAGRRAGRFDDELVEAAAELVRHWVEASGARWITAVPSDRSGPLVPDFAERLARAVGLPFVAAVERAAERPPQREMATAREHCVGVCPGGSARRLRRRRASRSRTLRRARSWGRGSRVRSRSGRSPSRRARSG